MPSAVKLLFQVSNDKETQRVPPPSAFFIFRATHGETFLRLLPASLVIQEKCCFLSYSADSLFPVKICILSLNIRFFGKLGINISFSNFTLDKMHISEHNIFRNAFLNIEQNIFLREGEYNYVI